ncbi:hypothetical protein EHS14_00080 [Schaalia georgiae]|nr:hypothetical protein EHS14_00080 [Schaalia georgiae]
MFVKFVEGIFFSVDYEINDYLYNKAYYLTDGIYLRWSIFVKTILNVFVGGVRFWFAT